MAPGHHLWPPVSTHYVVSQNPGVKTKVVKVKMHLFPALFV